MTTILVTGAAGQLGRALLGAPWPDGVDVVGTDRTRLDLTDADQCQRVVGALEPDSIVNCAAYTAVDSAETDPDLADAVNRLGVAHLAAAAAAADARLVQLSTDYVFDGTKGAWYTEDDPVAPLGVYGRTKAAGEDAARALPRHLVLRTSWVYGATGANFVTTMKRLAAGRDELRVVDDQIGCPSSTGDLAAAIAALVLHEPGTELVGTFHLAGPQAATWYELACAALADEVAAGAVTVTPIATHEFPTAAPRPADSRLDSSAISDAASVGLRPWSEALPDVLAEMRLGTPPDGPRTPQGER